MSLPTSRPLKDAFSNQRLVIGHGSTLEVIKSLKCPPGIVVTSSRIAQADPTSNFVDLLFDLGWHLIIIPSGEPALLSLSDLSTTLGSSAWPSAIFAIGGGSVIDFAKILSIRVAAPETVDKAQKSNIVKINSSIMLPPIIAVPSTIGSGAESSSSALIQDQSGRKVAVVGRQLIPEIAVLDSSLAISLEVNLHARSLLDVLGHAIESSLSRVQNPGADFLASSALAALSLWNREESDKWHQSNLTRLQTAGNFAGQAQDRMLAGPAHGLAHAFPKIPHAVGVGIFLKAVSKVYSNYYPEVNLELNRLLQVAGFTLESYFSLLDYLLGQASIDYSNFIENIKTRPDSAAIRKDPSALASPIHIDDLFIERVWQEILS